MTEEQRLAKAIAETIEAQYNGRTLSCGVCGETCVVGDDLRSQVSFVEYSGGLVDAGFLPPGVIVRWQWLHTPCIPEGQSSS